SQPGPSRGGEEPDGRPRLREASPAARVRARADGHRDLLADPADGDARRALAGLHPYGARQGTPGADGRLWSCAAQRAHPRRHRAGRHPRDPRGWRAGHRAGLLVAGCRAVHVPGGDREGLSDRAGGGDVHEHAPRAELPAARSDVRVRRPADQGEINVATTAATAGRIAATPEAARASRSLWSNAWWKLR